MIAAAGKLWVCQRNRGCFLLDALEFSIASFLVSIPGDLLDIQPGQRALNVPDWAVGME